VISILKDDLEQRLFILDDCDYDYKHFNYISYNYYGVFYNTYIVSCTVRIDYRKLNKFISYFEKRYVLDRYYNFFTISEYINNDVDWFIVYLLKNKTLIYNFYIIYHEVFNQIVFNNSNYYINNDILFNISGKNINIKFRRIKQLFKYIDKDEHNIKLLGKCLIEKYIKDSKIDSNKIVSLYYEHEED
jgi:hypothetical protein